MLERVFKLKEHGTSVRTEVVAGITTFMTMAYILAVNPNILGETGMPKDALFTATALTAIVGSVIMGLLANMPIIIVTGMGLNAFFAYTVVLTLGYSWQMALTAVFIEGLLFVILTFFNIRELIVNAIPQTIKNAIPGGIGLFIALIGLKQSGLVVAHPVTLVTLGDVMNHNVWIASVGLLVTGVLISKGKDWAILAGISVATIIGIPLGITSLPENGIVSLPPDISPIFMQFDWSQIFTIDMAVIVLTLLFVNLFDTVGALLGIASKAGLVKPDGSITGLKKALFSDAIGTTIAAVFGTSTVAAAVESASGVAAGGRTGLTAISAAGMFVLALFFAPLFLLVPTAATAPALIIVGLFMISTVVKINFDDFTESIPAFLTVALMPFTYSIAHGIVFGFISYTLIKMFTGRFSEINITMYVVSFMMLLQLIFG